MSDWKGVAITLVVASIVAVLGAQMVGLGDQLQERQTEIKTHGAEVYHNQTIVVSSDDCYETCGMTADSINRRQRAILITLESTRSVGKRLHTGRIRARPLRGSGHAIVNSKWRG